MSANGEALPPAAVLGLVAVGLLVLAALVAVFGSWRR